MPLISIIIPNFNKANFVKETLLSLMAQTYANFEVVVVDDASTDDSVRVIEETIKDDARFKLIKQSQGRGGSAARNLGFANSSGEFVMFFDSDDSLAPTCLERRLKTFLMAENQRVDFCVFPMGCFKKEVGDSASTWIPVKGQDDLPKFLAHQMPWTIMQPLWKRTFLEKLKIGDFVGPFDEEYPRLQDVEMHTRALLIGAKYQVCDDGAPDCYYRIDVARTTMNREAQLLRQIDGFCLYVKKMGVRLMSAPSHAKAALRLTLFSGFVALCYWGQQGEVSQSFEKKRVAELFNVAEEVRLLRWYHVLLIKFYCLVLRGRVKGINWMMRTLLLHL